MAGTVGHQTGDARQKGVADTLAACGETVIKQYGNWDENTEVQIATDTITATPDLNVIFAPHGAGARRGRHRCQKQGYDRQDHGLRL